MQGGVVGVGVIFATTGAWSVSPVPVESIIPVYFTVATNELLKLSASQTFVIQNPKSKIQNGITYQPSVEETLLSQTEPVIAEMPAPQPQITPKPKSGGQLDLSPEIIEGSPVLQRWLRQVPNVLADIANEPSFHTRLRLGYSQFSSTGQAGGVNVGVDDIFIGRTGLTVSGDYQASFDGRRTAWGADLRYYLRPLGAYVNVAPLVGYRELDNRYSTDGLNFGVRLLLVLSRGGAADISLTQSWVAPGSDDEVGMTTLSFGYAVTRNLRLSTDIQKQNARQHKDNRVGIGLEWMP